METFVEIRPYGQKELAALYGVSDKSMRKWLRSIATELGTYEARLLTIQQVETLFRLKGHPRIKQIQNKK
ncbi:MAG: hypothetical protein KF690_06945 [Bacteroidetes bacterium]|nr:hypothetical protein [Bacteroidota bacterium]